MEEHGQLPFQLPLCFADLERGSLGLLNVAAGSCAVLSTSLDWASLGAPGGWDETGLWGASSI